MTAQLIDATRGFHLWSQQYDREMAEIFALQDEISEQIFLGVGAKMRTAELQRARRKPTDDLNAYEAIASLIRQPVLIKNKYKTCLL